MNGDKVRGLSPPDPDWYGPWCNFHAVVVAGEDI